MTVRLMYDSITASSVPSGSLLVAGYLNGAWANVPDLRARFPRATVVEISVTASFDGGTVLDVESGDASPAQAPGWVLMRRRAGVDPTVYTDAANWPAVRAAFAAAGVVEPHWWIADYDNDPAIPVGAVAKQYATNDFYDTSSVSTYWPGVDPAPIPPEVDVPLTTADAQLVVKTLFGTAVWEAGDKTPDTRTVQQLLEYLDQHYGTVNQQVAALSAQVTALSAAVNTLAKGEVTAAEVQAAVAAALKAAGHVVTA